MWRALSPPPQDVPLALCDARTLAHADLIAADAVFETGFDPLAGGFDAGLPANQVFSQWISVLPTDQIVAVEYTAAPTLDV